MDHSLLNPNQIRHNNISYWDNPYDKDHPFGIDIPDTLFIPLASKGTKVQFETRTPTNDELENCPKIDLTSSNEWNPHQICMNPSLTLNIQQMTHRSHLDGNDDDNADNMLLSTISLSLISLKECLLQAVQVQNISETDVNRVQPRQSFISHDRHQKITADRLAERFCIGPKKAISNITRNNSTGSPVSNITTFKTLLGR